MSPASPSGMSSASDDEPIVSLRKKANANKPAKSALSSQSTSVKKQATKPDASTSTKKKRSRKTVIDRNSNLLGVGVQNKIRNKLIPS